MLKNEKNFSGTEKSSHPLKQQTLEEICIDETPPFSVKSLAFMDSAVFIFAFSNNIQTYVQDPINIRILIISIVLILCAAIFSVLFCLVPVNSLPGQKVLQTSLLLLNGLVLVFTDPGILKNFFDVNLESFCPCLSLLILRTCLHSSLKSNSNIQLISPCLGIISLTIQAVYSQPLTQPLYSLFILFLLCFYFRRNKVKTLVIPSAKYEPVDNLTELDYGDIISQLEQSIKSLNNYFENHQVRSMKKIIEALESVWLNLKKNKNIYSTKFERISKYMDEQDRTFIEQSCLISYDKGLVRKDTLRVHEQSLMAYGVAELLGALALIGKDWNFDTFFISTCSGEEALKVMGLYTVRKYGLDQAFNLDNTRLELFLKKLESGYKPNPYHNSTHAADVMASFLFFLNNSDMLNFVSNTELMSGIISTLGHDVGHPGRTNRFLIMTQDDIAMTYNDISVLENMHASLIFKFMKSDDSNIMTGFSNERLFAIRKCIIEMVLATDMAKHFDMMAQYRVKYYDSENIDFSVQETRSDIFKIMVKAADIGHAAKSIELHEKWCRLVIEEFYEQGDMEKALGLPVSMYCDRETTDLSKSQAGFIKNIVSPLFSTLSCVLVSELIEAHCLSQIRTNEMHWLLRRKTLRGQSLIIKKEDYVSALNSLPRKSLRKPSLQERNKPTDY